MPPQPIDVFRKNKTRPGREILFAILDALSRHSRHVDDGCLQIHLEENYGELSVRELELFAKALTWGLVVGDTGNSCAPCDMKELRRCLPRPAE